jgi:GntR family transcriptional regulator
VVRRVDPTSDRPAYRQIADLLRADIREGRLPEGSRLPSERELIESFGAARGTVRQAIAELRTEGLIVIEHGRGAYVRRRPQVRRVAHDRFARRHREAGNAAFLAETEAAGLKAEVSVLHVGPDKALDWVAERLQVRRNSKVLIRRRLYLADGEPVEVATSYIPWRLAQGTRMVEQDTGPGGIYARLEEIGHTLGRFSEEVTARMGSPDETRLLSLTPGVPVLDLVRVAHDTEEQPVEVCHTVMAADRFVLSYELPAK